MQRWEPPTTSIPFLIFSVSPHGHAAWRRKEKRGGKKEEKRKREKGRTQSPARVRVAEFKRLLKPLPCIRIIVALVSRHEHSYRYLATIKPFAYTRSRTWSHCFSIRVYRWSALVGIDRSFPSCKETVCYILSLFLCLSFSLLGIRRDQGTFKRHREIVGSFLEAR